MKLTPWFSGDQKPVRVGVYERKYGEADDDEAGLYCYWDGLHWHAWEATAYGAYIHVNLRNPHYSAFQYEPWRGVLK